MVTKNFGAFIHPFLNEVEFNLENSLKIYLLLKFLFYCPFPPRRADHYENKMRRSVFQHRCVNRLIHNNKTPITRQSPLLIKKLNFLCHKNGNFLIQIKNS